MNAIRNLVISEINGVFDVYSPKGKNVEIKNRSYYGISFCKSGKITYIQNGEKYISERETAVILPLGGNYSLKRTETGVFTVINFKCANDVLGKEITVFPISNGERIIKLFDRLKTVYALGKDKALCMSIFYEILSLVSEKASGNDILLPAVAKMQNNFQNENMTVSELASLCRMSESYFRRCFEKIYGVSPKKYLMEIRINSAKGMLSSDIKTVSEIAGDCGFSGVYHFCKAFKREVGMTPSEYRKCNYNLYL